MRRPGGTLKRPSIGPPSSISRGPEVPRVQLGCAKGCHTGLLDVPCCVCGHAAASYIVLPFVPLFSLRAFALCERRRTRKGILAPTLSNARSVHSIVDEGVFPSKEAPRAPYDRYGELSARLGDERTKGRQEARLSSSSAALTSTRELERHHPVCQIGVRNLVVPRARHQRISLGRSMTSMSSGHWVSM